MDYFELKVLLSFLTGGFYITLMTVLSERFGTKIGGILTGLPSTALIGLIFIGWTQGTELMIESAKIMPASIALSTIFLISFVSFYKKNAYIAYFKALAVWTILNGILLALNIENVEIYAAITLICFAISSNFFRKYTNIKPLKINLPKRVLMLRFIFSGSIVALSVIFAKLLGGDFGGVLSSFPAAFSATILISAPLYGAQFIKSLSKGLVLGAFTISSFAISVYFITAPLGAFLSVTLSFLLSIFIAVLFIRFSK